MSVQSQWGVMVHFQTTQSSYKTTAEVCNLDQFLGCHQKLGIIILQYRMWVIQQIRVHSPQNVHLFDFYQGAFTSSFCNKTQTCSAFSARCVTEGFYTSQDYYFKPFETNTSKSCKDHIRIVCHYELIHFMLLHLYLYP